VHFQAIRDNGGFRSLSEGQKVEFNVVVDPKGMKAQDVIVL
jgi:cold shock CspA family protein